MLSQPVEALLERYGRRVAEAQAAAASGGQVISVHTLVHRAASWYEKFRNLFEYQEEHALRRVSLERILKRRQMFGGERFGLALLQELVGAGYLPNHAVPEAMARRVDAITERYRHLAAAFEDRELIEPKVGRRWCATLAASELNDLLFPSFAADLTVEAMFDTVAARIDLAVPVPEAETASQLYVACRRVLLRSTDLEVAYGLWRRFLPDLPSLRTAEEVEALAPTAARVLRVIEQQLKKPLTWRLVARLKNHGIYFSIIRDIVERYRTNAGQILGNPAALKQYVEQFMQARYVSERAELKKRGRRAIAYIFLTKMLVALGLELPYDLWVLGVPDYRALGVNVVFHPFLLFLMTRGLYAPGAKNTAAVLEGVQRVVVDQANLPAIRVVNRSRQGIFLAVFSAVYAVLFAVSFGVIVAVLRSFHFNPASITLFVFFLALVSYFGLRIRHLAKRWSVERLDEGALAALWSLFTLPIVRAGRWLSITFSSINIFVFILDFIIEAPLKVVLKSSNSFLGYLRDKREEMY